MGQLPLPGLPTVAIGKDERAFFVQLGARMAALRKDQNITQVQMAETLDVSQQTVNSYEVGRRRVPVSLLPALARSLGVSVEELIGEPARPGKRGPAPKIQQQLERVSQLPKPKQRMVLEVLEAVLAQQSR